MKQFFNCSETIISDLNKFMLGYGSLKKKNYYIEKNFSDILYLVKQSNNYSLFFVFLRDSDDLRHLLISKSDEIFSYLLEDVNYKFLKNYLICLKYCDIDFVEFLSNILPIVKYSFKNLISLVLEDNYLNFSNSELVSFKKFLNNFYIKNSDDVILEMVSDSLVITKQNNRCDNIKFLDDCYVQFFKNIFDSLISSNNLSITDVKVLGNGVFSEVYKIGDKILKIGNIRITFDMPNSNYILQPLIRRELDDYCTVEVSEACFVDELPNIEDVYNIYVRLREDGIVWNDPRMFNIGKLLKPNVNFHGGDMFISDYAANGFSSSIDEIFLEGQYVIIDTDAIYSTSNWTGDIDYFTSSFEERYQIDKKGRLK